MKLDISMICPYTINVLYVDDNYNGEQQYTGEIEVGDFDFDDTIDWLTDEYAFKLNLDPEQFEVDLYVDEEELIEKEKQLEAWLEWKESQKEVI